MLSEALKTFALALRTHGRPQRDRPARRRVFGRKSERMTAIRSSSIALSVAVARAPKDGYTLLIGSAANIMNAAMNPNLSFDFYKDFAPIALMTSTQTVLVVAPELGVKNVNELIALAKSRPDKR